jgi:hypothetical protein
MAIESYFSAYLKKLKPTALAYIEEKKLDLENEITKQAKVIRLDDRKPKITQEESE